MDLQYIDPGIYKWGYGSQQHILHLFHKIQHMDHNISGFDRPYFVDNLNQPCILDDNLVDFHRNMEDRNKLVDQKIPYNRSMVHRAMGHKGFVPQLGVLKIYWLQIFLNWG